MRKRKPKHDVLPVYPPLPVFGCDAGEDQDPNDYSIWVHRDGVKSFAMRWRLSDYGEGGALDAAQVAEIAERHDLGPEAARLLSRQIGYCLDIDSAVNSIEVSRAIALRRAVERCEKALKAARRGKIEEAVEMIFDLSDHFSLEDRPADALQIAKEIGSAATVEASDFVAALERLNDTPDAAFDMSPRDRRNLFDGRRRQIVWECCYLFLDIGRDVTYATTDRGVPGGPLIDLVQDVTRMINLFDCTLSAPTIRKDIELFMNPDPTVDHGDDPRSKFLDQSIF
ncbi:hypothetical protein PARPLA_00870 [Rhodobacteraceae bacterium THAF1]|uniref:hypothetical protein n=1 Tax=Palleronia sp. THAF1 TaxID=2587842 RepID=UPI000F3EBF05|nr:hypothetical protein [Palleronia sp. THAF1]QFU07186.1 hypothetical protein FIU81_00675 [Palleronia sp. THAF1]VDC19962.1 hypothetical protein PARPLA_00870 [Rhodobacteraceae bacterium THAF1]